MPSSKSEARARVAWLALMSFPAWACATAIDNAVPDGSLLANHDASGGGSAGSGAAVNGGSAGKNGVPAAAGSGVSGSVHSGGAPSSAAGSVGKGGTASGGTGSAASAGKGSGDAGSGSAGKGGASSGGAGSGSAGKGGSSNAGSSNAGSSNGGASGGAICDAAHAVATLMTSQVYTGKANDCVRVAVNPTWSTIALQFQPLPGTTGYPVPFTFFSCGGNGTGSLTADYANTTFKSGTNPGCDFFVQFGGGATTIKVTYYD